MQESRLTEFDLKIIKQAIVYTQSSWETWHKEGIFPNGWSEGEVVKMLDALVDVAAKWDTMFFPEVEESQAEQEKPLPNNILFFPGSEE